uniref:Serpin domain-containing protein n=1 Tax=Stomoxys calcitrans TaxID=35570 RepID=A0A1I8P6I9_STOCA
MTDTDLQHARGGAEFTQELFKQLEVTTTKKNTIFSPFSIRTCMAIVFAGAKGETAEEIAQVMKYVSNSSDEVAASFENILQKYHKNDLLKIANKVYLQKESKLRDEYANITKDKYNASAELIDFAESQEATKTINDWVEEKTAGKITNLIKEGILDASTRLVLLNALHFKGEWCKKFDEAKTSEEDFWISAEESIKLPYMTQKTAFRYGEFDQYNCVALEMPYKDSDLSLFALLPDKRDGLKDLAENLKDVNLLDLSKEMCERKNVQVMFPKFKTEYSLDLAKTLQKMGIKKAFGNDADLSNMLDPAEGISLSNVIHKASIEVNEEGCEAAAATAGVIRKRCAPIVYEFVADHPFLYWIWDKQTILFAGAFVNAPN